MAGKFEVYKDKSGGFRFRLKAANGEVIASSQTYKSKASAMGGVESVKKNAASDVVDLTEEPAGTITGVAG
ncbi:YegP family protein [Arthrobacter sp. UYCu723]